MSFVDVFFSLIFIKLSAVFGKTVDASAELLGSKQFPDQWISWSKLLVLTCLCGFVFCFGSLLHFLLMSMYLHPDPVSLSVFAHDWQHDVFIKEERLKIQLLLTGVSCFYLVQRTDSKSWLEELTRSTSTHLFILSFLTLFFTLHHTLQKERKTMQMIVSFFLCVSAWK